MKHRHIFNDDGNILWLIYFPFTHIRTVLFSLFHMGMPSPSFTSSCPLGNTPACIYVGEMGYNSVYDAIKSFLAKAPTAHAVSLGLS